jgi:subtilisin-like proprotein convertase family protein
MNKFTKLLFLGLSFLLFSGYAIAQEGKKEISSVVGKLIRVTPKLADIDPNTMYGEPLKITRNKDGIIGISEEGEEKLEKRLKKEAKTFIDPLNQAHATNSAISPNTPITSISQNFDGLSWSSFDPSDNNLAVGATHVIQIINDLSGSRFKIWNKTTGAVVGSASGTVLATVTGVSGAGDPVVMYDQLADRWVLTEFGPSACCNSLIMAVSVTGDPTGAWKVYQYTDPSFFPDYPKYSVWHNAYYARTSDFNTAGTAYLGASIYAFDRAAMLSGAATATMVRVRLFDAGSVSYYNMNTIGLDGTTPSTQNGLFAVPDQTNSKINLFEFTPNFTTPASSVVGPLIPISVAAYSNPPASVAQQGSAAQIQTLGQRLMYRLSYRNRGGVESILIGHTIAGSPATLSAVRWYEFRRTAGNWGLYQQGTIAGSDGNSRLMPGLSMDANGNIGLLYNVSGATAFPSIVYTARNECDALGQMTLPETTIINGTVAHAPFGGTSQRWGDYNTLWPDPSIVGSFWGTAEYGGGSGNATRVANINISGGAATFTSQPTSTTVCAGTTASFAATAAGNPPLTYQWQVSTNSGVTWTNIVGATAATYSFTAVAGDNGKQFRCVATSSCGTGTSNAATLTITTLSQGGTLSASSSNACAGPNSTVLTLAGSVGNIIQWESSINGGTSWTVIPNTTTTLTVTNLTQTTQYRVLVQSAGCTASYSSVATVTFVAAGVGPILITSDAGTTLCAGDPALLTALSAVPGTVTVSSGTIAVAIPDASAAGVSTPLTVSGVPAAAIGSSASVNFNITHTWDGDLTLFLKSPNNQVLNLVNKRGGSADNFVNTTISSTAVTPIGSGAAPFTGTFLPDGSLAAAAPTGFTPTATTFTPLYSTAGQINGTWLFAARDNAGGDVGTITSWSLTINYNSLSNNPGLTYVWSPAAGLNATNINPVASSPAVSTTYTVVATNGSGCTSTASIAMTVNQRPKVTTQPVATTVCANSSATFTIAGTGTGIAYQWQESTNGGTTWTSLSNVTPYSGVTTPTLTINPAAAAMNNYQYRCVVSGICSPAANSNAAVLSIKALPVVTVTPASGCGGIPGISGTLLTASGADTYTWSPVTGLYTNATSTTAYTGTATPTVYAAPTVFTTYIVTGTNNTTGCSNTASALINYTPPAPTISPVSVAMCLGDAAVRLTSSTAATSVANFSTGTIAVAIPDYTIVGATSNLTVSGIPANSTITGIQAAMNITHTWVGDLVIALKAPSGNILNLDGYLSNTGGAGATTGFTNTRIGSTGTAALSSGSNPYNGLFKADAFVGPNTGPTGYDANVNNFGALATSANANGTWTLAMYDGGPGDVGTLTSWSLQFTYVVGVPASAATWSPIAGLFNDPAALIPYTGTPRDTVYTRPTPSGVYTYQATVNSLPPAAVKPTTSFANNNANSTITFNVKNNNAYPVTLSSVSGIVSAAGTTQASLYAKAGAINGAPGAISAANGWNQVGTTQTFTAAGGGAVETFLTGLNLTIAPGQTYGLCVQALDGAGGFNLAYSTLAAGTYVNSAGGVDIITGDNIGFGGTPVPAAPTFTPRGFIGNVGLIPSISGACTSPARSVVVTVNQPISLNTTLPANAAACTDKSATFTVGVIAGTSPSYQWQVSSDAGNTFTNVSNGGVYSGVTTATLTVSAPPVSMSGYIYRCVVSGAAPCTPVNSRNAFLTVNPLPTVVIAASPYQRLFPGLTTTVFSTVTPAASVYTWLKNGAQVSGATGSSLLVNVDGLGDYTLRVTDVNGCVNTSNLVSLKDSSSGKVFIYPNPNGGQFQVRYYSIINNTNLPRGINVYDARGKRVLTQQYTITAPYSRMDVNLSNYSTGVYWIEVVDVNGNRLAMGRAEVLR